MTANIRGNSAIYHNMLAMLRYMTLQGQSSAIVFVKYIREYCIIVDYMERHKEFGIIFSNRALLSNSRLALEVS